MALRSLLQSNSLTQYVQQSISVETDVQKRLRDETALLPQHGMQIGPDQGAVMALLVRIIGARRALEIGTFTGYSALCVATALPEDGKLIACDISVEWTDVARRYWREAGVSERIELRLAPAQETLDALLAAGAAGSFDFAFIDADKTGYDNYYESVLDLLRPGGLVALDNMLWGGRVADASGHDADTAAIHALNLKIRDDSRVDAALLTVGDGLMLARKR